MKVIEKGNTPDGMSVQIEDWSKDYSFCKKNACVAFYPVALNSIYKKDDDLNVCIQKKSVLSMIPYPERSRTFRATLEFDTEEAAKKAFESMVSGVGTFMDYMDYYSSSTIPKEAFVRAMTA